jgi:hypothetical protein
VDQERGFALIRAGIFFGPKTKQQKFAITFHDADFAADQMAFYVFGIVDEIGFAQRDGEDAAAGNSELQSASDGFYFRKLWHFSPDSSSYHIRTPGEDQRRHDTFSAGRLCFSGSEFGWVSDLAEWRRYHN